MVFVILLALREPTGGEKVDSPPHDPPQHPPQDQVCHLSSKDKENGTLIVTLVLQIRVI